MKVNSIVIGSHFISFIIGLRCDVMFIITVNLHFLKSLAQRGCMTCVVCVCVCVCVWMWYVVTMMCVRVLMCVCGCGMWSL